MTNINDSEFLSAYYVGHRDELLGYLRRRVNNGDDADDILQDVFLRLLTGLRLITREALSRLVYKLLANAVADYYRSRHVRDRYEHQLQRGTFTGEMESVISARQLMERLEHSLARMSENSAHIYRLHIYDGMKVGEIATELSLPYKQVEYRLGKARQTVRQQFRFISR